MRVIGLGNDLVDIRRIEKSLERFGERFINRIFTTEEIERSEGKAGRASSYAKRFAAKEACAKALGSGFFREGVVWTDVAVSNEGTGKPVLRLCGGALKKLESLTPENMTFQIDLSMTDDYPWAQAIVLITALAAGE